MYQPIITNQNIENVFLLENFVLTFSKIEDKRLFEEGSVFSEGFVSTLDRASRSSLNGHVGNPRAKIELVGENNEPMGLASVRIQAINDCRDRKVNETRGFAS